MNIGEQIAEFSTSVSLAIQQSVMEYAGATKAVSIGMFAGVSGVISTLDVARAYSNWRDGVGPASEIGIEAIGGLANVGGTIITGMVLEEAAAAASVPTGGFLGVAAQYGIIGLSVYAGSETETAAEALARQLFGVDQAVDPRRIVLSLPPSQFNPSYPSASPSFDLNPSFQPPSSPFGMDYPSAGPNFGGGGTYGPSSQTPADPQFSGQSNSYARPSPNTLGGRASTPTANPHALSFQTPASPFGMDYPPAQPNFARGKAFLTLVATVRQWAASEQASPVFFHVMTGTRLASTDRLMKAAGVQCVGGSYVG